MSFHGSGRLVRRIMVLALVAMSLFAAFDAVPGCAQEAIERKVKTRVAPTYPDIARRMGLTGTVRLQVVVAPNGTVKETKVIGGHPILVNAAVDAVKKWKFESANTETTGNLEFRFEPGS